MPFSTTTTSVRSSPGRPRRTTAPPPTRSIRAYNETLEHLSLLRAYVYATVSTNSRDERAQALFSELERHRRPASVRCWPGLPTGSTHCTPAAADPRRWPRSATRRPSTPVRCCASPSAPPTRWPSPRKGSTPSSSTTGSTAWGRLQADVTSQLTADGDDARRHHDVCRCRRCAAWPPTPIRRCAVRPTTPRWRRGHASPRRARRR